jgi:hypothetical protein
MARPFCVVKSFKLKRLSFFSKPQKLLGCQIDRFGAPPYRRYVILDWKCGGFNWGQINIVWVEPLLDWQQMQAT